MTDLHSSQLDLITSASIIMVFLFALSSTDISFEPMPPHPLPHHLLLPWPLQMLSFLNSSTEDLTTFMLLLLSHASNLEYIYPMLVGVETVSVRWDFESFLGESRDEETVWLMFKPSLVCIVHTQWLKCTANKHVQQQILGNWVFLLYLLVAMEMKDEFDLIQ